MWLVNGRNLNIMVKTESHEMVTKGLLFLGSGHLFPLRYKRSCYDVALETQCKAGISGKLPLEQIGLIKILGRLFLLSEF